MPRVFKLDVLLEELGNEFCDAHLFLSTALKAGKVELTCLAHAETFSILPGNLRRGQTGCKTCIEHKRAIAFSERGADLLGSQKAQAAVAHNGKYDYSKVSSASGRVKIVCPTHGEFEQYWHSHLKGHGCGECANIVRGEGKTEKAWAVRKDKLVQNASARNLRICTSLAAPLRSVDRLTVDCPEHGEYETSVGKFEAGKGCWKCYARHVAGQEINHRSASSFAANAAELHNDAYDYSKVVYVDSYTKVAILCKKHDLVFHCSPGNHLQGKGCPKCGVQLSKAEDEIATFLRQHTTVEQRNRTLISPQEVDIYLPEHNLAIEYHGLYWHTEDRVGDDHRKKHRVCLGNGVELWQIFQDEWEGKREQLKNRLLARIGCGERRQARTLQVTVPSEEEARIFLNAHHTQGAGPFGATCFALLDGTQLVAIMTVGQARRGGMGSYGSGWEVWRYASLGSVVGGFGKLFAAFVEAHAPQQVVSFCDLRYGNGRVYKAVGFELQHESEPDYWWLPSRGAAIRVPRYQTQKHKLATHPVLKDFYSPDKTEREICEAAGWKKILGVGNQKWLWTAK